MPSIPSKSSNTGKRPRIRVALAGGGLLGMLTPAQGTVTAVARLSPEQQETLHQAEKGELKVMVQVTDEARKEPVACEMNWAWFPAKRTI